MRDPKRIGRILDKIKAHWKAYPDLRFMQLLLNLKEGTGADHFYLEDDELERLIDLKFFAKGKEPKEVNEIKFDEMFFIGRQSLSGEDRAALESLILLLERTPVRKILDGGMARPSTNRRHTYYYLVKDDLYVAFTTTGSPIIEMVDVLRHTKATAELFRKANS